MYKEIRQENGREQAKEIEIRAAFLFRCKVNNDGVLE